MKLRYYLRGLGIGIVVTALLMGFTKGATKETLSDDEIIARAEALGMVQSSVLSSDLNHEEQGEDGVTVSYNTAQDGTDIAALPDSVGTDQTGDAAGVVDTEDTDKTADAEDTVDSDKVTDATGTGGADKTADATGIANTGKTSNTNTTDTKTASASKGSTKAADTDKADNSTKTTDTTDKVTNDADNSGTTGATTITVTINSGDGSDTVARRLAELGVITDAGDFDRYLCQNGYDKKLATGNHEINAGAGYQEIAETLIKRAK